MYNCEVCKYAEWDWSEEPCIEGCSLGYEVFSNEECEGRQKNDYEDN